MRATTKEINVVEEVLGKTGATLAIVFGNTEESKARANLFAAAPDLLAAAEKIFAHLNTRLDEAIKQGGNLPFFDGIGELHDAINKAKGKSE
jgi:hypothetical protein